VFWKKRDEKDGTRSEEANALAGPPKPAPAPPSVAPPNASTPPAVESTAKHLAHSTPLAAAKPAPDVPLETGLMREQVIGQLRTVYDPEIPVNIYELGLVYKIDVDPEGNVKIEMTLTSPACPSAAEIPLDVRRKVESIDGVKSVDVEIVWDPPWTMEFMSEAARVQLGFF
jgi:FeS assembly SUF system protein